jgi:uncharacterized membrane protein
MGDGKRGGVMAIKRLLLLSFALLFQTSCIVVGYTNRGGWFVWPGGLFGVLIIVAILFILSRRRR